MKTYVITVSKSFLAGHPRAGEPTDFKNSILKGIKRHTIRTNADYWKKVLTEVMEGRAVLSIREWSDRPYRSKQLEIGRLTDKDGVGYQTIALHNLLRDIYIDGKLPKLNRMAISGNDGLCMDDFFSWFFPIGQKDQYFNGIIIHFTPFRY